MAKRYRTADERYSTKRMRESLTLGLLAFLIRDRSLTVGMLSGEAFGRKWLARHRFPEMRHRLGSAFLDLGK